MENFRQLLPKYQINDIDGKDEFVEIKYNDFGGNLVYSVKHIIADINTYKFIHDNFDYFVEMLLSNGFKKVNKDRYNRGDLYVNLYFNLISVVYDNVYYSLENPRTMFDELRKHIGVDIPLKSVICLHNQDI